MQTKQSCDSLNRPESADPGCGSQREQVDLLLWELKFGNADAARRRLQAVFERGVQLLLRRRFDSRQAVSMAQRVVLNVCDEVIRQERPTAVAFLSLLRRQVAEVRGEAPRPCEQAAPAESRKEQGSLHTAVLQGIGNLGLNSRIALRRYYVDGVSMESVCGDAGVGEVEFKEAKAGLRRMFRSLTVSAQAAGAR